MVREKERGTERGKATHLLLVLQLVTNHGFMFGGWCQGNETGQGDGEGSPNVKATDTDDDRRDKTHPDPRKEPSENERVESGFESEREEDVLHGMRLHGI